MNRPILHMIGNAHIDPVWLWQWPEGYQEVLATFRSALERLEEYPEFVFTHDSVCYLAWVEENDPTLFEAIRARVQEGRWHVIGGWWVEPDCNIPGGESYVRQALYGQRYLLEKLGILATTGANVDSFGHNASLPQLLAKSGLDSYVFLRPGPHELPLPGSGFRWESPDGSQVLAYRIPHEYCAPATDLGYHVDKSVAQLSSEAAESMVFYGVGNHGGGPTRANLDSIRRLNETNGLPELRCSSPRAFFDRLASQESIPVVAGELQHHGVGCYSAHSGIKQWNRRAENLLQRAEKWASVASVVTGAAYPRAELEDAWKLLLFNQFHDTLAGTSIAPAYEDARDQIGHACSVAGTVFNRAVQSISSRIDIRPEQDMTPLVVFNPHPWRLRADVELEFAGFRNAEAALADDAGEPVPVQPTRSHATVSGPRGRLVFPADVPPLGYRTYRLYPAVADRASPVSASDTTLENEHVSLEIDPETGWLRHLVVRETGFDVVAGQSRGHAVVVADASDTWGHRVRAYDEVVGGFVCTSVRLVEQGPVRAVVRIESTYERSTLAEELILGADARFVEVRAVLDWHERHRLLKLRFPTTLVTARATFEIPYGHLVRPATGDEEPAQAWVDVSDERGGLSVLNDAKYSHDATGGNIGMTVARSPVYAWHEPKELDPDAVYEYLDQGRQRFAYRLLPHAGDWRTAGTVRLAAELNQPAFPLLESYHDGPLPHSASYLDGGDGSVVVTVLKADEDGSGDLVVRAYEAAGEATEATIRLPLVDRVVEARFGACEVKTLRVPRDPEAPVVETDLLERPS
ncbi:MAG TPA: glycoside hydrolase family 38 C-terminal domain-containing protein [Gaiella sp.]|nr:glycoside hydrolase family 38 C-terminal domain-containing protein [Gaiella sp.]